MATIKDVARLAGVSVATVSRVLNQSPKASAHSQKVVAEAMAQLNYIPNANARALAQQSTATLGLLVNDVSDPFFGAMVKAVDQVAIQTGNFLLIGNGYHRASQEKLAIEQLIRHQCQSLVVHAKMISDEDLQTLMRQVPGMVVNNRVVKGFESRCIALDNSYGSWLATRHLISQGHQKIAYICSRHAISDAKERLAGYHDALRDHGLTPQSELIAYGEPDENGGEQAMVSLLAQGRYFTAIACYNDSMAAGALAALTDNGLHVPEQISMIGFDDVHVSRYVRPRLTTVRYPVVAMAQQAAHLALALGNGLAPPPVTHLFQPTLVIRHSVARLEEL
ncbi:HTH-type transcriptional regulator GalR [Rosenbergiella epipactidis]|uniref:HTH-type transcriptional regulator GalR n=1 Tax=Rosenbergiella epipactidis TaxID=1544694 RepID=UPI001F4F0AC0|nr:HTH-type transcriptional regulator GalR [Rosenbergiella epipactidis]